MTPKQESASGATASLKDRIRGAIITRTKPEAQFDFELSTADAAAQGLPLVMVVSLDQRADETLLRLTQNQVLQTVDLRGE